MANQPETSIDQTIASAVHARIEAEVTRALAGDEVIGRYVAAALNEVVNPNTSYRRERRTYLQVAVHGAIQNATKSCIEDAVALEIDAIKDEIRKAVKRRASVIADSFVDAFTNAAASSYRFSIELPGS